MSDHIVSVPAAGLVEPLPVPTPGLEIAFAATGFLAPVAGVGFFGGISKLMNS